MATNTMNEKDRSSPEVRSTDSPMHDHSNHSDAPLSSWKYKSWNLGPLRGPYYASPLTQLLLVSFVCFLCPGMFNALNGLGGGGQVTPLASSDANTALYSTFAVIGFFAGSIINRIGVKYSMAFGGLGYCIYVAAFLVFNYVDSPDHPVTSGAVSETSAIGFITFAGALLGICAGVLWCAQGTIMMSYPREADKGKFVAIFWMIFNLGGVIGALVPLGQNINVTTNSAVSTGTYVGFLVLTAIGGLLAWTLVDAQAVVRTDGSRVILMKNPSVKSEFLGLWQALRSDPWIIALFPMFFASNWFYTYHFNDVNAAYFNTRTRALNNVLYWTAQIIGAGLVGPLLDLQGFRRSTRARAMWIGLMVLTLAIWGGGYAFQKTYDMASTNPKTYAGMDWTTPGYVGPMFLYIFYGVYDAIWQNCVYWLMGALTNNSRRLANYAGFYKGLQSAGSAVTWRMSGLGVSYMAMFATSWGLLAGSLVVALPVLWFKVQDTVSVEQDLKFSDENVEDVFGARPVAVVTQTEGEKA